MSQALRFGAAATAVVALVLAIGLALGRSAPAGSREAMLWACGVALVGTLAGLVPLLGGGAVGDGSKARPGAGPAAVSRFLASMLLRLAAVAVGSGAVLVLGNVSAKPFLLWLAVSYLALLVVETAFALRVFRSL